MEAADRVATASEQGDQGWLDNPSSVAGAGSIERQLQERFDAARGRERDSGEIAERLVFTIDGSPYSASLASLREALSEIPATVALPFSPGWLIGLFPLRTDLVALVDARQVLAHGFDVEPQDPPVSALSGKQALIIGDTGRLIAIVVERIGDIVVGSGAVGSGAAGECARRGIRTRYVEDGLAAGETASENVALPLNLDMLVHDVLEELEEWTRYV